MSKDTKGEFCGLVRICDKASGSVIWMSEESKLKMEQEEEDALNRGGGGGMASPRSEKLREVVKEASVAPVPSHAQGTTAVASSDVAVELSDFRAEANSQLNEILKLLKAGGGGV
jgi:hypothetical protein